MTKFTIKEKWPKSTYFENEPRFFQINEIDLFLLLGISFYIFKLTFNQNFLSFELKAKGLVAFKVSYFVMKKIANFELIFNTELPKHLARLFNKNNSFNLYLLGSKEIPDAY